MDIGGGLPILKLDALVTWLGPLIDITRRHDSMEVVWEDDNCSGRNEILVFKWEKNVEAI